MMRFDIVRSEECPGLWTKNPEYSKSRYTVKKLHPIMNCPVVLYGREDYNKLKIKRRQMCDTECETCPSVGESTESEAALCQADDLKAEEEHIAKDDSTTNRFNLP